MLEDSVSEREAGDVEVASARPRDNDMVETNGLSTLFVRVGGPARIDLQLRGPEVGRHGRRFRAAEPLDSVRSP